MAKVALDADEEQFLGHLVDFGAAKVDAVFAGSFGQWETAARAGVG